MNVDRDLIPMREAAAALGVSVDALRERIRRGTIEARKESGPLDGRCTGRRPGLA